MSRLRTVFFPSFALLIVAGSPPAAAQQRVDVTTRRAPQGTDADAVRRMQRMLDSLTQRYNEGEELSASDRRRVEVAIDRTMTRLVELMRGANEEVRPRIMLRTVTPQPLVMPRGWIGIVAEGAGIEPRVEQGELVVRYLSYPRIVSVDPSSPAQTAGIVPNDTLIAYDGRDVRENDIYLSRLLRPNTRVTVRLRRDGRVRDVPIVVAEAPSRIAQRRNDEVSDDRMIVLSPVAPDAPFTSRLPMATSVGGMARGSTRSPSALQGVIAAASPGMTFNFTAGGVAGAQLITISEGLGKRLNVSGGVLVANVPVGSPASESGLEDGDVLVKVGDVNVKTVLDVRRVVGQANENGQKSVDVVLLRDSRTVRTTLRW